MDVHMNLELAKLKKRGKNYNIDMSLPFVGKPSKKYMDDINNIFWVILFPDKFIISLIKYNCMKKLQKIIGMSHNEIAHSVPQSSIPELEEKQPKS